MATFTAFLNLSKPTEVTDLVDIDVINANMDAIDLNASDVDDALGVLTGADTALDGRLDTLELEYHPWDDTITQTDLALTGVAGEWNFANFAAYRIGQNIRGIICEFTRSGSGATLTGSASGNIGDSALLTSLLPAAGAFGNWRPAFDCPFVYVSQGNTFGNGKITIGGQIVLQTLHNSGTLAANDSVLFHVVYMVP